MYACTDPAAMTPGQRFAAIAAILAVGFLRLKQRTCYIADMLPPVTAADPSETRPELAGGVSALSAS